MESFTRLRNLTYRTQIFILLGFAAAFGALFCLRPYWYTLTCAQIPTPCVPESVNAFDRIAFQYRVVFLDFLSNIIQNVVGVTAFILPLGLWFKKRTQDARFETFAISLLSLSNLFLMELTRAIIQRPRPLVFDSPALEGLSPMQYTSFYSGHTSFVALASLNLAFFMKRNFKPHGYSTFHHFIFVGFAVLSTVTTAALRVGGGRHFPTDVIAGALVGWLLAWGFHKISLKTKFF